MILDFHPTNTGFLAWVLTILQSQLFHQSWQFQIHVKKWNCVISRIEHAQNYLGFQQSRFQFSLVSRLGRIEPDNSNGIAHGKFHCMKVWFSQRPWLSWLFFPAPENKNQYKLFDTRGLFRILILRVLSVHRIFPLRVLTLADSNKMPKNCGC